MSDVMGFAIYKQPNYLLVTIKKQTEKKKTLPSALL